MKRLLIGLISICFVVYWFIILSYNLPNKYFADKIPTVFSVFNHTWSLFAPMPTENIRLYYDYDLGDEIRSFEVLEKINSDKSKAAPFLTKHRIKDFGLTGPIYMIDYRRMNHTLPDHECPDEIFEKKLKENETEFYQLYKDEPEFVHLYNFGKEYAHNIALENIQSLRYRIVFVPIETPDASIRESRTIFTSPFQAL